MFTFKVKGQGHEFCKHDNLKSCCALKLLFGIYYLLRSTQLLVSAISLIYCSIAICGIFMKQCPFYCGCGEGGTGEGETLSSGAALLLRYPANAHLVMSPPEGSGRHIVFG